MGNIYLSSVYFSKRYQEKRKALLEDDRQTDICRDRSKITDVVRLEF